MKYLSLFAALLCSTVAVCQNENLLQWEVSTEIISDSVYTIKASCSIPEGWHVYGENSSIEGLESVKILYDYENVTAGSLKFITSPISIQDPIFQQTAQVFTQNISWVQTITFTGFIPPVLQGIITANLGKKDEFIVQEQKVDLVLDEQNRKAEIRQPIRIASIDLENPVNGCGSNETTEGSVWKVFLLGFIGGLIALLTPCVFPMIPVTISFFTGRSPTRKIAVRNGILYGFFILLIYLSASIPFHILGNVQPEIFNSISTNAWLNIIFFAIFLLFAISFFGFFELTLPSSLAGKVDSKSGLGSIPGIFFMALTLAIVSFSCTGPILGTLLVGSLSGGAWQLTSGLAGFGVALGIPFALFAVFPEWLKIIPKSGGWLDTVKKVLAFIELALALKFLSNADLVMHWGLLKREVFIGLWMLISLALSLYLFGIFRLPHDYKGMRISWGRKITGILALVLAIYLLPGITNSKYANLQLLSGFPPPLNYSIYGKENAKGKVLEANVINDYEAALQLATEENKLLLIDFTGWACVNCRKMEENVWTKPEVYNYIQENFILVSLYVDDREKLDPEKRFSYITRSGNRKQITTLGDKWATFEAENFNQVSQPLYVIINTDEKLMTNPVGYVPDANEFLQWLQCGMEATIMK